MEASTCLFLLEHLMCYFLVLIYFLLVQCFFFPLLSELLVTEGSVVPDSLCVHTANKLPSFLTSNIGSHKKGLNTPQILFIEPICSAILVVNGSYSFQDTDLTSNRKSMVGPLGLMTAC